MIWHFARGAFRNIATNKTFTAINILGLAVGVACALIISLYVIHETSFDKFHTNWQNIYRITIYGSVKGVDFKGAATSGSMSKAIYKEIGDVESATRVGRFGAWLVTNDSIRYNEDNILFVDTNFFRFFDGFKLIQGDKSELFSKPRSMVLTESASLKYFSSINTVGKKLRLETENEFYTVTGVVADPPSNSHIHFDMLASLVTYDRNVSYWFSNNVYNYVRLKENVDSTTVLRQLNGFFKKYILPEINKVLEETFSDSDTYRFALQPVYKIHLHSNLEGELESNGRAVYVFTFAIVAILILIIACLNFMNLTSANSIQRAREVMLRRANGAGIRDLVLQFLTESVIYSLLALTIALILAELILPVFNSFLGLKIALHLIQNIPAILLILLVALLIGLFSGFYPAFFVTSIEPVMVLQGSNAKKYRKSHVRSLLVVLQLVMSIVIIELTLVISAQNKHMIRKDLGFDKEHILVIRRSDALKNNFDAFKKELLLNPDIQSVANSTAIPGRDFHSTAFKLIGKNENSGILLYQLFVSYDFSEVFKLTVLQGRFFDSSVSTDTFACVINESAAKLMGLCYPVGTEIIQPRVYKKLNLTYKVIGVIKDFNFKSVDKQIQPLILCLMPGNKEGYINVRVNPQSKSKTIDFLEKTWQQYSPEYPFQYFYLNDDFSKSYFPLVKLSRIFFIFSVLAIFLACLGLYGLISYSLNQRIREIGVRKSLGASVLRLIILLGRETFWLVLISTLLAWIVSYFLCDLWLDSFYYHISLKPSFFLLSALIVFIISMSTISIQSYRNAKQNPVEALKIL